MDAQTQWVIGLSVPIVTLLIRLTYQLGQVINTQGSHGVEIAALRKEFHELKGTVEQQGRAISFIQGATSAGKEGHERNIDGMNTDQFETGLVYWGWTLK